jgi:nitrite reductase (NO-forming)
VVVDFKLKVPGGYALVDHSIFRAFNKGAVGTLAVTGPDNAQVYSGKQADTVYNGKPLTNLPPSVASSAAEAREIEPALREQYARGKQVYLQTCFVCHQPNGLGVGDQIPPLANSDVRMNERAGAIRGVLQGRSGELTVKGKKYNGTMIAFPKLSDQEIADVITYARNSWGNRDTNAVTAHEVGSLRPATPTALAANPFE